MCFMYCYQSSSRRQNYPISKNKMQIDIEFEINSRGVLFLEHIQEVSLFSTNIRHVNFNKIFPTMYLLIKLFYELMLQIVCQLHST